MFGKVGLLLGGVLLRVSRLHVNLKLIWRHAAPPNIFVETNLTLVFVLPCVTLLDVQSEVAFTAEDLVT